MINAGFEIIQRENCGEFGVALGENLKHPINRWVTWLYRCDSPNNFFWGHYDNDEENALADFWERVKRECK